MPDEKKSTYTGYTEARKKSNEKYLKESVEDIRIRVPKGQKEVVKKHAEKQGESMKVLWNFHIPLVRDSTLRIPQSMKNQGFFISRLCGTICFAYRKV